MAARFVTIGHSSRSLGEFIGMLRAAEVRMLVDVRAFPRSRANPVFDIERLPDDLARAQIGYRHCRALGGRRSRRGEVDAEVDAEVNALWRLRSFHNYADYALGEDFARAFAGLVRLGEDGRTALMCAEALWWRCHRRIIADYLLLNGHAVDHLMAPGQTEPATPTPGARRTPEGTVVYPAGSSGPASGAAG